MSRLTWDGVRTIELGVDRAVFYPPTGPGVAWNGFISLKETPLDSQNRFRYVDGIKTRLRQTPGECSGVIEAFTYPDSFYDNVLVQTRPRSFGLSYRSQVNDAYILHLVYNLVLTPAMDIYQQREPDKMSWSFTTTAVPMPLSRPSAHLIVNSSVAYPWTVVDLEDILYGTDAAPPRLPTPQEVWDIVEQNSLLLVTDHGDGSFSVTGPDDAIIITGTTFEITWPSVINLGPDTYQISSL